MNPIFLESVWAIHDNIFGSYEVTIQDGVVQYIQTSNKPTGILAPGFVDLHIHGGNGIDFMSCQPEEILQWCNWLETKGYEALLPTTVTAPLSLIKSSIGNIPDHPMIHGFHLEGPFISDQYPGAQPQDSILNPPDEPSDWDEVFDHPLLKVITIAPEIPGALKLIKRLSQRGVKIGIGHTNSTYFDCEVARNSRATHTTHTFNAMKPFHHREAGTVGFALLNSDFHGELIYDRIHVCKESAELLIKCKDANALIAISDGTKAAGLPVGTRLNMWGLDCIVGQGDVRLESGALAGSTITLLDAFQNLATDFGIEIAIRSTSINPRNFIGIQNPLKKLLRFDLNLNLLDIFQTA